MEPITIRIKNMVCPRCIKVVREELEKLGLELINIRLGVVTLKSQSAPIDREAIKNSLEKEGFELMEDKHTIVVESVKTAIIELIYSGEIKDMRTNFSDYISKAVGKDYHQISIIFSLATHMTVEKYLILQKVERAKELLSYGDLKLNDIARQLGYSSIAHLSNQFKRVVGQTPSEYKREDGQMRKGIDQINDN